MSFEPILQGIRDRSKTAPDTEPPPLNPVRHIPSVGRTITTRWLDGSCSPENTSTYAFSLGVAFGACSLAAFLVVWSTIPPFTAPIYIFVAALALFHFLEFLCTAIFNPHKLKLSSFLLNQSVEYRTAQAVGTMEYLIQFYFFPGLKTWTWITSIGFTLLIMGQSVRILAMWHAKSNFSHDIVVSKERGQHLVKTGIYRIMRHPSYFGFYYWAIGSQILLCNPISFFGFLVVLHKFFSRRIAWEEETLIEFFGTEYLEYRKSTPTYIPAIA